MSEIEPGNMVLFGPYLMVPDFMLASCHDLHEELRQEAAKLQPWQPGEFNQHAAANHEASHCVVAVREGCAIKSASIFRGPASTWLGEFWIDWPKEKNLQADVQSPEFLSNLRIALAGRRGELLFTGDKFCLRAGLDELTYALMMIVPALVAQSGGDKAQANELYGRMWDTTLAEVDETLLAHRNVVEKIAEHLMRRGTLNRSNAARLLAPVSPRAEPPPIRTDPVKVHAFDPLAYAPAMQASKRAAVGRFTTNR